MDESTLDKRVLFYADKVTEVSIKFAFYSLALSFTILGLAIETADRPLSGPVFFIIMEHSAWLVLVVSSLTGLIRLRYTPRTYLDIAKHLSDTSKYEYPKKIIFMNILEFIHFFTLLLGIVLLLIARW